MKTFVPVLALAAGVSATFHKAPPFSFPGNTDNKCTDKQKPGFSWDDLDFGDFFDYKDFNFRGWKCEDDGEKRSKFAPRTFGKAIGGTCFSDKQKSPSFGCGASVDKFSLGSIHVKPEFDCDLEFHYDMPDGSTCKHRSPCRKSGTTVVNRQCGGAKNVTIIYPPQPHLPKPSCTIKVPTISFDCDSASSTQPPKTKTTKTPPGTTAPPAEATTTPVVEQPSTTPSAGTPPGESSTPPSESSTPPTENTPPAETTTPPAGTPVESTPVESTPPSETTPAESNTSPAENTPPAETSSVSPGQETSDVVVPPPVTKTITTSYDSTSTVFTTSTQTITSCAPTVPDCPANSVVTTVVTVAVSTTICPVTETLTTIEGVPTSSVQPGNGSSEGPSEGPSAGPSDGPSDGPGATSAPVAATSSPVVGGTTGVVSSVSPVETLPCPGVVPSCLNTFLFKTGCSDNTDTACYCPDATFVKNVYDCLYAHGETDSIIAEAVAYFQGICGKWVNENPAIATDATVTTYITVTAQPTVAPVYTTVIVDVTTVVPCTDDAGEVIPSSSTTITVSTSMTVPQIDFTTGSSGGVEVIPITAVPAVTGAPTPSVGGPGVVITANGTAITVPTGTGALIPSSTPTQSVVVAAGGRVGASFGLAAAVAFAAALL